MDTTATFREGALRYPVSFIEKCMHVKLFSDKRPGWFLTELFGRMS